MPWQITISCSKMNPFRPQFSPGQWQTILVWRKNQGKKSQWSVHAWSAKYDLDLYLAWVPTTRHLALAGSVSSWWYSRHRGRIYCSWAKSSTFFYKVNGVWGNGLCIGSCRGESFFWVFNLCERLFGKWNLICLVNFNFLSYINFGVKLLIYGDLI